MIQKSALRIVCPVTDEHESESIFPKNDTPVHFSFAISLLQAHFGKKWLPWAPGPKWLVKMGLSPLEWVIIREASNQTKII